MVHIVVAEGISCVRSLDPIIFFSFVPHCILACETSASKTKIK